MADFSVTMTGVAELSKRLEALKYDARLKGGRFALRKAAQVIRDQARTNAMSVDDAATPESIPKSIVERWSNQYNKRTGDLMFRVGVLGGAKDTAVSISKSGKEKWTGTELFYWRFLEFGTEKMRARPFFARALPESSQRATDTFITEFNRALDRALRKAAK